MALDKKSKAALLAKMRKNQNKSGGSKRDPTEWRPKYKEGETQKFKVYILPPLMEDDICLGKDGSPIKAESDWDVWFVNHGHHFINKRRHQCPRIHGTGDCPMCDAGFELMRDVDDKDARRAIAREWLSQESRGVNIYFLDSKENPDDLRGKVLWWNMPNVLFEQCVACIERDNPGDDEDDPQPFGLFFMPDEAFPVSIQLQEKGGYNNYDGSKILAKSRSITDDEDELDSILNRRTDIRLKFDDPDPKKLSEIVDDKLASTAGGGGFDDDDAVSESKSSKSKAKDEEEEEKPKAKAKDEEEEEEEKPKAKAKAKAKAKDEEEEEEEKHKAKESDDEEEKPKADDEEVDEEMQALLKQLEG